MTIDTNETLFVIDDRNGCTIIMTTKVTFAQEGEKVPLWHCHLPSDDHLDAVLVWIGEHEVDWPEWREIAETQGFEAISAHIAGLWAGGIEQVQAVMLTRGDDDRALAVSAMLGTRQARLLDHRFESHAHREAFMAWCFGDDIQEKTWYVARSICTRGRANGVRLLDRIAAAALSEGSGRKPARGRRRGRAAARR